MGCVYCATSGPPLKNPSKHPNIGNVYFGGWEAHFGRYHHVSKHERVLGELEFALKKMMPPPQLRVSPKSSTHNYGNVTHRAYPSDSA